MQWCCHLAAAGALLALFAQQAPQPPSAPHCRKDRPVDEYIAEIRKAKKQRNKNPLPSVSDVCIFGWCKGKVEPTHPEKVPSPPPQAPKADGTADSSSREGVEETAVYDPIAAAEGVEVGDYYFTDKKYRAALSRYQEALESKPDDPAIFLRLGRTFEKLDEPVRAFENYDASLAADPAGPSSEEARKGAERLRPEVEKRGEDPAAITARNRARIVPRCPPATPAPSQAPR